MQQLFKQITDRYESENNFAENYNNLNVETLEEITAIEFLDGPMIIDMKFAPNSQITPKTEMDRFIHDQFPYINDGSIAKLPYKYPDRPSKLGGITVSTV